MDAVDINITPERAGGDLVLSSVQLTTSPSPVPEPGAAVCVALAGTLAGLRRKRRPVSAKAA